MSLTKISFSMIDGIQVNVRDFGALGNGINDDTASIQAAVTAAKAVPNATVYFPPNLPSQFYKTTAPIVIDGAVSLRGDSPAAVTIIGIGLGSSQYVFDYNCLAANVVEQITVQGMTIRSDGVPSALRIKNASYVNVKDIRVYNVQHGVIMEGARCFSNVFEELNSYSVSGSTVRFASGFTGGGHFTFLHCTFTGDTGFVLPATSFADSITMTGCNFEQCITNSFYIGGSCRGVALLGCRTEGCNGDDFQINPASGESVEGITITGTSFTTDAGASRPIIFGGAGGSVRGFSITGNQVEYAGAGTSFVYLNGDGESGLVAGNYFAQSNTTPVNVQRSGVIVFGNENSSGKCAEFWGSAAWGVTEGSFTPVDASGAGLTLTGTIRYTKIGRVVNWQGYVLYPSTANSSAAAFGGFPFVMGGLGGNVEGRAGGRVDVTNLGAVAGLLNGVASNTSVSVYTPTTGVAITNATMSGKYMYCSGSYSM